MCGQKFESREAVRNHYIDIGCFRCKKCGLALGSRKLWRLHKRENLCEGTALALPTTGYRCRLAKCEEVFKKVIERDQEWFHDFSDKTAKKSDLGERIRPPLTEYTVLGPLQGPLDSDNFDNFDASDSTLGLISVFCEIRNSMRKKLRISSAYLVG